MGYEIRRVAPGWSHPKSADGHLRPLLPAEELACSDHYVTPLTKEDVMPAWGTEATALQVYETDSEGTPVSPVFLSEHAMRSWLMERHGLSPRAADGFINAGSIPTYHGAPTNAISGFAVAERLWGNQQNWGSRMNRLRCPGTYDVRIERVLEGREAPAYNESVVRCRRCHGRFVVLLTDTELMALRKGKTPRKWKVRGAEFLTDALHCGERARIARPAAEACARATAPASVLQRTTE